MSLNNNTVYPKAWVVYCGSLDSGYHFYGPFKRYDDAWAWSNDHIRADAVSRIIEMFDVRADL